jgi:hypothetical protein
LNVIGCRVPREAFGDPSCAGDYEHIDVAVVFAREGDGCPIRREQGTSLDARTRRQAASLASCAIGDPDIAGVGECDLSPAESRLPQKLLSLSKTGGRHGGKRQRKQQPFFHEILPARQFYRIGKKRGTGVRSCQPSEREQKLRCGLGFALTPISKHQATV